MMMIQNGRINVLTSMINSLVYNDNILYRDAHFLLQPLHIITDLDDHKAPMYMFA